MSSVKLSGGVKDRVVFALLAVAGTGFVGGYLLRGLRDE